MGGREGRREGGREGRMSGRGMGEKKDREEARGGLGMRCKIKQCKAKAGRTSNIN